MPTTPSHPEAPARRRFLGQAALLGAALPGLAAAQAQDAGGGSPHRATAPADRGPFWPGGSRLAISISMQFEAGAQPERGASGPFPPLDPRYPDYPMQTWYAYGVREGIPRLLDLWERTGVTVTSHMVGQAVERHPELAREIVARGHEAAGHGQTWEPQYSMSAAQERASYVQSIASIERATGVRPVGFNAFWMRGSPHTLSILQSLGFLYHIDDLSRDEPSRLQVGGKPFVVVPYTVRNNDIVRFDSPATSVDDFLGELKADFDVLYAEGATRRRMMSISAHDRISGTPARVQALERFIRYAQGHPGVAFLRKDEIARFILGARDVPAA
ncbi:polysaccharide deacetylase family protein [Cupriavidus malaysiensis]|uniref:Polysaccharide deacetylase n=1 Tax=Cupriavidus malaysiensis TaxID=367825 RepID=A0ABM6F878_9BURK|nr:polysaccharide deacetylase family protein [Cupriavidus malaysiensis]AOZ07716.1 polysaccharide deacetylase [Cupriavidus malaysiensis]